MCCSAQTFIQSLFFLAAYGCGGIPVSLCPPGMQPEEKAWEKTRALLLLSALLPALAVLLIAGLRDAAASEGEREPVLRWLIAKARC